MVQLEADDLTGCLALLLVAAAPRVDIRTLSLQAVLNGVAGRLGEVVSLVAGGRRRATN